MAQAISRGAVAARKWASDQKRGRSISELSRVSGIDRVRLTRILSGKIRRVSANDAFAIEQATGGEVPAKLFSLEAGGEGARKAS